MNRDKQIRDESLRRLINNHREEYEDIKFQLNKEYDAFGGILK